MLTIAEAIATFGVQVGEHLDRQAQIPVLAGLQFQGDVAIVPRERPPASDPVPAGGVAVVRSELGGSPHVLLAAGAVTFDHRSCDAGRLLGVLSVADGAVAYLAHPQHAYNGIAPGTYEIRRRREMAGALPFALD
jgi:hypothetical protein